MVELDQNDDMYLAMLRQPIFVRRNFVQDKMEELERFLCNIFDQSLVNARRRPQSYLPKTYEKIISCGRHEYIKQREERKKKAERKEFWRYLPNRILLKIAGENNYNKLKNIAKRG